MHNMTAIVIEHSYFQLLHQISVFMISNYRFQCQNQTEFENRQTQFYIILIGFGCRLQPKPNRNFRLPHRPIKNLNKIKIGKA